MSILLKGIVHICGEPDTGKTTFALECGALPERIAFIDDDIKTSILSKEINFGFYENLVHTTKSMKELELHKYCLDLIDRLELGRYDALIWDTWSRFEKTFQPYVLRHPTKFRDFYSPKGDIKGAEIWIASFDYEAQILDELHQVAPSVFLITHLKSHNIGGRRTGKEIPDNKRPVIQKSQMRIWLRHNPDSPVPIGLVLKRAGRHVVTDMGIRTTSILPRKVKPRPDDVSLWDTIRWYFDNPVGNRAPTANEMPDEFELSILDGTLTEDQKMVLRLTATEEDSEAELFENGNLGEQVKELIAAGKSPLEVSQSLGIELPIVAKHLQ